MLEVSLLPTITREPAVFPRHWPCLWGRFREFSGLLHTVRLTWASMVPVQVHQVPTGFGCTFTNILFYKTICLTLLEQLKWRQKSAWISQELRIIVTKSICLKSFFMLQTNWASTEKSAHVSCYSPLEQRHWKNPPAHWMSVSLCRPTSSYVIKWKLIFSGNIMSFVLLSDSHVLSHLYFPLNVNKIICEKGNNDFDRTYRYFWFVTCWNWSLLH